ncbi:hypothetical protein LAZ67_3004415 [Cordylochernes scorpioides]|uniref:RNA-directed DNA polymerase n=1 Tax=Cordylochernes scorpioides TaxID=51811 RepID=A0ABY6K9B0_9ARAC|nr:hypothetical protein LAZ67_3004415 [Cordylochernes scorpioides]
MEISPGASKTKGNDKPRENKLATSGKKLTTNEATRHTLATVILELTAALQGARSPQLETVFRNATHGATDARTADFPFNCADSANSPDPVQQIFQASHTKPKTPQWRPFEIKVGNPPNDTIKLTLDLYLTQDLPCTFLIEPDAGSNILPYHLYNRLKAQLPNLSIKKPSLDLSTLNSFTKIIGHLTFPLTIGQITRRENFHVVNASLPFGVLTLKTLYQYKLKLNYNRGTIFQLGVPLSNTIYHFKHVSNECKHGLGQNLSQRTRTAPKAFTHGNPCLHSLPKPQIFTCHHSNLTPHNFSLNPIANTLCPPHIKPPRLQSTIPIMPKQVSVHRHSSPTYHANIPHNIHAPIRPHATNTHNPHNKRNTRAKRQQQRQTSACTTVKNNTIIPSTQNIEKIHTTKQPHNRKTLQSFLKAVNVYKEFIPDHARLRTPLVNLLKKDVMWVLDDECQKAFTNLKENLTTHPTLHLYQEGLPCQVYCNTSTFSITGVLKQVYPDGKTYTVQHFSRSLRSHERNYSDLELQCLAIVESVDNFRTCLNGRKFTIFSDHHALQWLKTIKNPSGRLFRWSLRLSSYEYEVRYIKGKLQYEADLLSRNPFCGFLDATLIKTHQPPPSKESTLTIDHNGLHTISRKGVTKIILPKPLIQQLLQTVHTQYNHPGISQMSRIISTQYYWQGMSKDIKQKVKTCPTCQLTKRPVAPTYGELSQPPESKEPFDLLSLDTIAGFAKYGNTKIYLHVVVDHFSRYAWALPSKSTSTTTYQQVLKRVFQDGSPKRLLTDRAPAFTSPKFRSFLLNRNIHPLLTTSNNPQANGLCERLNATLTGKLRLLHLENPKVAWTKLVKKVTLIYNKTPHSTTGFPPIYLMFGILPPEISNHNTPYPDIDKARKIAHTRTQNKHLQDKNTYDQRHKQPHFEVGDLVLVKLYHHPNTGKLAPYFTGPHTILEIISPNVVRIDRPNQPLQRDTDTIHVNKLKLYTEKIHYISPPAVSTYHIKHNSNYTFPFKHLTPELFPTEPLRFKPTSSEPFKHLDPAIFATRRFTSLFPDVKNCKPDNQLNHITPPPKDIKQENCEPTNHSNSTINKKLREHLDRSDIRRCWLNSATAAKVGDYCLNDQQCRLASKYSYCKYIIPRVYGRCQCPLGYFFTDDNRCLPRWRVCIHAENARKAESVMGGLCEGSLEYLWANLGGRCQEDADCELTTPGAQCSKGPKPTCVCRDGFRKSRNGLTCQLEGESPQRRVEPVSLGKPCNSTAQCAARDQHSTCLNGICECLAKSSRCSSRNTGCHRDTFQCRSGHCISWYFVCDKEKNCPDGSDEDECQPHNCPKEAFECNDGTCLSRALVCNGRWECPDGSDEARCYKGIPCDRQAFRCGNGQCLPQFTFCNAVTDCADGSDELVETCERGLDGCGDNSDETRCDVCCKSSVPPSQREVLTMAVQTARIPIGSEDRRCERTPLEAFLQGSPGVNPASVGIRSYLFSLYPLIDLKHPREFLVPSSLPLIRCGRPALELHVPNAPHLPTF